MSFILNIDTATETASVALCRDTAVLASMANENQQDHAAWIHSAINRLMKDSGYTLQHLQAIAVTAGPGSYTGLRVGMATAKGLCYALRIPLITESTLKVMTVAAVEQLAAENKDVAAQLFCPMIDARRMEVFTAVYDHDLKEVLKPQPMILNEDSFNEMLSTNRMVFFGSGSEKFKQITRHSNAVGIHVHHYARHLSRLSYLKFRAGKFDDPAYAEPVYLKEFHTHTKK